MARKKKKADEDLQISTPTTFRELSNLTNGVLNSLLKSFGHSTKGKRNHKVTLLAKNLGISTTGTESDNDPFLETLQQVKNLHDGWTTDIRDVPEINLDQISSYLIAAHDITIKKDSGKYEEFTKKTLKKYKALRSYDLYESGHISSIRFNNLQMVDNYCALKCKANPSGDTSGTQYDVIVILNEDSGAPLGATCPCVAGLGEACTHVAGLLFAIEDFVSRGYQSLPTELSCTEKLCKWVDPKGTTVEPKPIKNVKISKSVHGKAKDSKLYRASNFNPISEDNREVDYDALVTLNHMLNLTHPSLPWVKAVAPAMLKKYKPVSETDCGTVIGPASIPSVVDINDQVLIPSYETEVSTCKEPLTVKQKADIYLSKNQENIHCGTFSKDFTDSLKWTDSDQNAVLELTKDQASSNSWMVYRQGMITSSNFQRVASRVNTMNKDGTKLQPNKNLINDLINGNSFKGNQATAYGKKHEDRAASMYQEELEDQHNDFIVDKCGLFVDKVNGYLGASPDRISSCTCHGKTLVEIKCPKTLQNGGNFEKMDYIIKGKNGFKLRENHSYYAQVQGQMAITGIENLHFVVYNTKDILIINVEFDKIYWDNLQSKLYYFYHSFMAPVLLKVDNDATPRSQLQTTSREVNKVMSCISNHTNVYPCGKCGKVIEENVTNNADASIGCDCQCTCNMWFHWKCIGYSEEDSDDEFKWFCPGCMRNCEINF